MTSITSLFNIGIYKNTLKRFKWGSFIYFIMLFFSVPFVYMVNEPGELQRNYDLMAIPYKNVLFRYGNFIFPMLMAIVVPTVVALLIYNYVHSSKHGIFVHSIPATRGANYISSLAAGFTLMILPVLANGIILYVMTFFGYSKLFGFSSIVYWFAVNSFIIFVMFSVATFSAFLTGNSFAQVAINAIIHAIMPIIAVTIVLLSDAFLYGYTNSHSSFAETLIEYTPVVWIISTFSNHEEALKAFLNPAAWVYVIVALALYALAMLIYKKRRIENCGEVAAFKVMKPILKYTVTAFSAVAVFGILINAYVHWLVIVLVSALVCAIVYFACEMILNKTLKVFHAYKGYFGFAAFSAVIICFCAFTSVFGFETRIPDISEIETATMYTYYGETLPVSSEEASKKIVTEFHKELISDIPTFKVDYIRNRANIYETSQHINVVYNLKNGKNIHRRYLISNNQCDRAISEMFAFDDYKRSFSGLSDINIDNIKNMELNIHLPHFSYSFALNEDAKGLLRAIEKDMETITYDEYNYNSILKYDITLSLSPEENDEQKIFIENENNIRHYYHFNFNINTNFKNAIEYLESMGYEQLVMNRVSECMYIAKKPVDVVSDKENVKYFGDEPTSSAVEYHADPGEYVSIEKEDALSLLEYVNENEKILNNVKDGRNYLVFVSNSANGFYANAKFVSIPVEELPEYLEKYVE